MNENSEGTPNPLNPGPGAGLTDAPEAPPSTTARKKTTSVLESAMYSSSGRFIDGFQRTTDRARSTVEQNGPVMVEDLFEEARVETDTQGTRSIPISEPDYASGGESIGELAEEFVDSTRGGGTEFASSEIVSMTAPVGNVGAASEAPTAGTSNSLDPAGRVMEKAATIEAPKKNGKKVGLIIALVVSVFIAAGCGVAAILLNMNPNNAVNNAIQKIMQGEAPNNVAISGEINLIVDQNTSETAQPALTNVRINLDSKVTTTSLINNSAATVTLSFEDADDISFDFEEVYASKGDLYFRIDGLRNAINELWSNPSSPDTALDEAPIGESVTTEDEQIIIDEQVIAPSPQSDNTGILSMLSVLETIDGEWLRVSTDEFANQDNQTNDSSMSCLIDIVGDIKNNNNSIVESYTKNPFVISTNKDLRLAQKNNPIYLVGIDNEVFVNFVNSIQNTKVANDTANCLGLENGTNITVDEADDALQNLPLIYVEVDSNNDFTRLYVETGKVEGFQNIIADLDLNYSTQVNVTEPSEYINFSDVIEEIFSSMYSLPYDEDVIVDERMIINDELLTP